MGNLTASPPASEWGVILADLLRRGSEKLKSTPGVTYGGNIVGDTVGSIVGKVLGNTGESLARGVEGWNYGDKLFDTRANVPLVNSKTEDMLGALPIGTGSKSGVGLAGALASMLRKDMLVAHSVRPQKLAVSEELPKELYNLSLGVGKDRVPEFGDPKNNAMLIARPEKFDPKTANTVLTALDSYTPRHTEAVGKRVDEIAADLKTYDALGLDTHADVLRNSAPKGRLWDRFMPIHPQGGIGSEGTSGEVFFDLRGNQLPQYGSGANSTLLAEALRRQNEAFGRIDPLRRLSIGPRHQSYEAFNESPYGAARINSTDPMLHRQYEDVYSEIEDYLHAYAGTKHGASRQKQWRDLQGILTDKDIAPDVRAEGAALVKALKTTHSSYGELKAYGPVGLNKENFAGIILPHGKTHKDYKLTDELRKSARDRGLVTAYQPVSSSIGNPLSKEDLRSETANIARWILKRSRE